MVNFLARKLLKHVGIERVPEPRVGVTGRFGEYDSTSIETWCTGVGIGLANMVGEYDLAEELRNIVKNYSKLRNLNRKTPFRLFIESITKNFGFLGTLEDPKGKEHHVGLLTYAWNNWAGYVRYKKDKVTKEVLEDEDGNPIERRYDQSIFYQTDEIDPDGNPVFRELKPPPYFGKSAFPQSVYSIWEALVTRLAEQRMVYREDQWNELGRSVYPGVRTAQEYGHAFGGYGPGGQVGPSGGPAGPDGGISPSRTDMPMTLFLNQMSHMFQDAATRANDPDTNIRRGAQTELEVLAQVDDYLQELSQQGMPISISDFQIVLSGMTTQAARKQEYHKVHVLTQLSDHAKDHATQWAATQRKHERDVAKARAGR